jgi:hypothetical protein
LRQIVACLLRKRAEARQMYLIIIHHKVEMEKIDDKRHGWKNVEG